MTVYIGIDRSQAQHDVCFPDDRTSTLVVNHAETRVYRHVKVRGDKNPGACPFAGSGQALSEAKGRGLGLLGARLGVTQPSHPACCDY